ncbi:MAG: PilN domain-containing protein [Frankiaceae bacterium]|nr:PilN domain-containing protein [Frankiaceae bacterium]MBV9368403.1 PilN domain-containing protein [Frankiales bacterium]
MTLPNTAGPNAADANVIAVPAQPVGTAKTGSLAVVNLLPPEIYEAAKFRRLQFALAGCGVAAIAVVGLLTYQAHHGVTAAKAQLAQAQSQEASLTSQRTGLQSVQDVYNQVAAKNAMLTRAMGGEVRWSTYLSDISLRVPSNVWLTSITATETGATGATGAPATPASAAPVLQSGIGTVGFTGVAFSHDDVATWLDALAKEKGFTNVYFTSSTKGAIGPRPVVNFASQVVLTPAALSGRFLNATEG